jgi:polysaccharide export outer membrane protein
VTVTVKDYAIRSVNVTGQVMKAGAMIIPAEQRWTILDAIAYAGGFTRLADQRRIEFTRRGKTRSFSFDELKKNSDPATAIYVEPGDLIHVQESRF